MTLRTKLVLTVLLEIALTITIVGLWAYQGSKNEIERLARDLLVARTEYAYSLCERYNLHFGGPTPELKEEFKAVRIANDGYIVALDNSPSAAKGTLIIHPTDEGNNLNNERFPHIQAVFNDVDQHGQLDRYAAFTSYRQETEARGRQGELKIAYYMYYQPWHWILLSSAYERDLFQSSDVVLYRTIEAVSAMTIVGLIIMTLSVRRILAPLKQLIRVTQEVAAGKLDATFVSDSKDEIGDLARSFNTMLRSLQHNLRITQEFEIAHRMQMEMLPPAPPDLPGLKLAARSLPATEVGGDFYDFIPLADDKIAIIVGDVSGKGVSGAMVMSAALSALRHATEEGRQPEEILQSANRRLVRDLNRNMFVAVFCGIVDLEHGRLAYANAGQTMPLLYRTGEASYLPLPLAGDLLPIGIQRQICYGRHQIKLQPDDLLVFYTDGIVDMMNDAHEPYSFERFRTAVQRHAPRASLADMPNLLIAEAERFAGAKNRLDDLTLVVAKFEGVSETRQLPATADSEALSDLRGTAAGEIHLTIPSQCGYEKLAMDTAGALAEWAGFPPSRIADLRTAVSEACLNAIEHGNRMHETANVEVVLKPAAQGLTVQIFDVGSGFAKDAKPSPDLAKKISGEEAPRGIGLFLIEQLVDEVEYTTLSPRGHVTTLRLAREKQWKGRE
jgi:serine phosphatase RsbU (regulator of sigma subunit)/anti-sigma regulatory factor (Ser/Thr protein kinase)